MGAAIWVSVEAMVFWFAMVAALWAACTFGPADERRSYGKARCAWNCGTVFVLVAAHAIENWPDLGVLAADKVSLLYVVLAAIGFLVPERMAAVAPGGVSARDGTSSAAEQAGSLLHRSDRSQTGPYAAWLVAMAVFSVWVALRQDRVFEGVSRSEFAPWINRLMEFQRCTSTRTRCGRSSRCTA